MESSSCLTKLTSQLSVKPSTMNFHTARWQSTFSLITYPIHLQDCWIFLLVLLIEEISPTLTCIHGFLFLFLFVYFFFSGKWSVGRFLFRERTSHLDYCSKVFEVKIRNCLDYNHPTFFRLSMRSSTGCLDTGNYLMPTLVKPGKIANMQITSLK